MAAGSISRQEFLKTAAGLAVGLVAGKAVPQKMETIQGTRSLGKTGLTVTPLGYGATRTLEPSLVAQALEGGIRFIDTGRQYFNGKNEEMIGEVLKGMRKDVVVQSKVSLRLQQRGEDLLKPETRERIRRMLDDSLEASLRALKTDYIDVLLLHNLRETDLLEHETVQSFFAHSKECGKILAWGFSSHQDFIPLMKWVNRTSGCDSVMIPYNHRGGYVHSESKYEYDWNQEELERELQTAHAKGIGIVAMKTCSGGPCSDNPDSPAMFSSAVKWVTDHDFIHTAAVAIGNSKQMAEHLTAFTNSERMHGVK